MSRPRIPIIVWHSVERETINQGFLEGATNPSVSLFREQIGFLVDNYTPISIHEFLELMSGRARTVYKRPPVLLTFDDGFKNVIDQALPVLQQFAAPAVFFVIAEAVRNQQFIPWYVERTHLLRRTQKKVIKYCNRLFDLRFTNERKDLVRTFGLLFRSSSSDDHRAKLLTQLADALGVHRPARHELDDDLSFVSVSDLAMLQSSSLLTVASHTLTHPFLDALSYEEQYKELNESHLFLSRISAAYFPAVAYPGGAFDASAVSIAGKIYKCAFALQSGASFANSYAFPRISVGPDTIRHLAYAISPLRMRYFIPLKRFLSAGIQGWR